MVDQSTQGFDKQQNKKKKKSYRENDRNKREGGLAESEIIEI